MRDVLSIGANVRDIAWDALDLEGLDATERARMGAEWAHRMKQEHLAVGAFAMITRELAEVGCEPTILALMAKASCDEVRHTEICRRFAVAALGAQAFGRVRGVPKIPAHPDYSMSIRALLHAVEMCCLGETCTGVYLTAMHERATHPTARRALEALLEDEIDHGRVGWGLLASADDASRSVVARELPAMAARMLGPIVGAHAPAERTGHALAAYGCIPHDEAVALYRDALTDILIPGFEAARVDTRALTSFGAQ
jgi:hypothetical protein